MDERQYGADGGRNEPLIRPGLLDTHKMDHEELCMPKSRTMVEETSPANL